MLDTLDILIGFTVVMLIVSMPVTMITQFIAETLNLRGKALLQGVTTLLGLLDQKNLERATARPIAKNLLRDPLIAKRGMTGKPRLAGTVLREELAKLIMNFATGADIPRQQKLSADKTVDEATAVKSAADASLSAAKTLLQAAENHVSLIDQADQGAVAVATAARDAAHAASVKAEKDAKLADNALATAKKAAAIAATALTEPNTAQTIVIANVLRGLDIDDPAAVLKAVRTAQLDLERAAPELANDVRVSMAMLTQASSDFLAKFNGWFDQTMDRVSETFTLYSRLVTALVALAVALFLQLDSISLINRLSADKHVRDALVQSAIQDPERLDPQPSPAAALKLAEARRATVEKKLASADKALADAKAAAVVPGLTPQQRSEADKAQRDREADQKTANDASEFADLRVKIAQARADAEKDALAVVDAKAKLDPAKPDTQTAYDAAVKKAAESKATASTLANAPENVATLLAKDEGVADLVNLRLVEIPRTGEAWLKAWGQDWVTHLFGVLLTAALLSLGGPFWYALLQNLLKLRPLLARKDEEQRTLRQTSQGDTAGSATSAGAAAPVPPNRDLPPPGERGDLEAVG